MTPTNKHAGQHTKSSPAHVIVMSELNEGVQQLVAYVARKLISAEVNYTTTEQEMLAMVCCFGRKHDAAYVARKLISAEVNYTTTEQDMLAMVCCSSRKHDATIQLPSRASWQLLLTSCLVQCFFFNRNIG